MTRKELLIIIIVTFITVVAWIIFDILHTRAKVEISPALQEVIEPIDPNFDTSGVNISP